MLPNQECRDLDRISEPFFMNNSRAIDDILKTNMGNFFIKSEYSPLRKYVIEFKNRNEAISIDSLGEDNSWAIVSPLYAEYGFCLIQSHPLAYLHYFIWLNLKNYFLPPLETLQEYNLNQNKIWYIGQDWFQLESPIITAISYQFQGKILGIYSYLFMGLNCFLLILMGWYLVGKLHKRIPLKRNFGFLLCVSFLGINIIFSTSVSIIILRYQFFPMLLLFCTSAILYDQLRRPNLDLV
jgi:hypothetical protein